MKKVMQLLSLNLLVLMLFASCIGTGHQLGFGPKEKILHGGLDKEDSEQVLAALNSGADPNEAPEESISPLLKVAKWGNVEAARLLLDKGADINAQGTVSNALLGNLIGTTALIRAASYGHLGLVELLIERGADINVKDNEGRDALHLATFSGHEEITVLLLKKGADPNVKNSSNWPPIFWAARNGHKAVVEALIEKGADLKVRNDSGMTVLHLLAMSGKTETEVVELLLQKGADINSKTNAGETPIQMAKRFRNTEFVELLRSKGAKEQKD